MNIDYNYNNYSEDILTVVNEIKKSKKKYDLIVGIAKGGLIPAVHLANIFDTPLASLQWSGKGVRDCFNQQLLDAKGKNVLLVDDILDNGDTINEVLTVYYPMDTATLIYNSINKHNLEPTYTGWIINRNELPNWFDFWWEKL
jgi:hypoxanthine phosphoribosyltransferase